MTCIDGLFYFTLVKNIFEHFFDYLCFTNRIRKYSNYSFENRYKISTYAIGNPIQKEYNKYGN